MASYPERRQPHVLVKITALDQGLLSVGEPPHGN
jgi:hypothetical protein